MLQQHAQIGLACLSFESSSGGLPRGGEHIAIDPADGSVHKAQDLQSTFTLILPHIEQSNVSDQFDIRYRYDQTPGNIAAAKNVPAIFFCPENGLSADRLDGKRDNAGFGCVDYTPLPYTALTDGAASTAGGPLWPTALTGRGYPSQYYATISPTGPQAGLVNPAKCYHSTPTPGTARRPAPAPSTPCMGCRRWATFWTALPCRS